MTSFGQELAEALVELRELAESRMRTTCTIDRIRLNDDGEPMVETSTEGDDTEVRDEVYAGKCRVGKRESFELVEATGASVTVAAHPISFPVGSVDLKVGDRVLIAGDLDTPSIVGDTYRVLAPGTGSQETAQRVPCKRIEDGVTA